LRLPAAEYGRPLPPGRQTRAHTTDAFRTVVSTSAVSSPFSSKAACACGPALLWFRFYPHLRSRCRRGYRRGRLRHCCHRRRWRHCCRGGRFDVVVVVINDVVIADAVVVALAVVFVNACVALVVVIATDAVNLSCDGAALAAVEAVTKIANLRCTFLSLIQGKCVQVSCFSLPLRGIS
jgi:hypothetical protein